MIASKKLAEYFDKFIIDEERNFTPGFSDGKTIKYSDHFSILIKFKDIPLKNKRTNKIHQVSRWNTAKPGGWLKFLTLTNDNINLKKIVDDSADHKSIDQVDKVIHKEIEAIKFKSFGKITSTNKIQSTKELEELQKVKTALTKSKESNEDDVKKIDVEILKTLKKQQKEKLEKEMKMLENLKNKKGNAAKVFQLKKEIVGGKKAEQEPMAIKDPETDKLVTNPSEIKKVVLKHCQNVLKTRPPKPEYEEDVNAKKLIHEIRMRERVDGDIEELTLDMFNKSLREVCKKKGKKYEFILNAGYDLKNSLFFLFKRVWEEEKIPRTWKKSTLLQLFKGKASFQDLKNHRSIHMKEDYAKLYGHIVVNIAKDIMMKNMSPFQIGAIKGHRAGEHIYVLKSMMQLYETCNRPMIISYCDYASFFIPSVF